MSAFRTLIFLLLCFLPWNADARAADACDIRSGDLLSVYVYRQEDMCLRVRVDSEGFIRFPVAGRIEARGRQPEQIGRSIAAALRRHGFVSPDVVVSVESYAPRTVFVLGEIQAGGSVSCLIPEGGKMTAMQALSAAGGLAPSADPARIAVRRQDASGAASVIPVPALAILSGGKAADVLLSQGVKAAMVTLGRDGAYVRTREGGRHVEGFAVKAVDATGAGDSFWAGVLYCMTRDGIKPDALTLDKACEYARFGNAAASICVENYGAIPAMPTLDAVMARLG